MALPISISECLNLINRGYKLYKKVKHEIPEYVADVAERIESLELYLKRLDSFLQGNNELVKSQPGHQKTLQNVLNKTEECVSKVVDILDAWKNKTGPGGLTFKWSAVAHTHFYLTGKPDELEELGKRLDRRQDEIRDWQQMLLLHGTAQMLSILKNQNPKPQPKQSLSPSPSPSPVKRMDYNLIFIDIGNVSRSVAAEAYTLLFREWTIRTGGKWPVNYIHSAGLSVKARSETAVLQQQLGMSMFDGGHSPQGMAMAAVFDNLPYQHQYKNDIRTRLSQRKSRGLTKDLFTTYDFIFVFNRHNLASLENLCDALAKKPSQATPAGKGKLVLLGEYGNTGYKEIWNPKKTPEGAESLENWSKTASNIETSIKQFLKKELGWIQPAKGAQQDK